MHKTTLTLAKYLVGAHLALWLLLWLVAYTRGLSDQDPSYLLVLLVYFINLPGAALLRLVGLPDREIAEVLFGCVQWFLVSIALAALYRRIKADVPGAESHSAGGHAPEGADR